MVQKVIFSLGGYNPDAGVNKELPTRVMVESPLGGDLQRNLIYARLCMRHSLLLCGESPMAFHLVYPQSLCDDTDVERSMGITRSFAWHSGAEAKLFYVDRGFSNGMRLGYLDALKKGIVTEFRTLSQDEYVNKLVMNLNKGPQSDHELEVASNMLKGFMRLEHGEHAEAGDATDFRHNYLDDLNKIKAMSEKVNHKALAFERLAMRHSLVEVGEAPLSLNLLYSQFISELDGYDTKNAGDAWSLVADKAVNYIGVGKVALGNVVDNNVEQRVVVFKDMESNEALIGALNDPDYESRERGLADELTI